MEITSAAAFLDYFRSIRGRTSGIGAAIPPSQLEWTHAQGRFTLGDIVRHIAATERWMFAENVAGRPSRYPGHDASLAAGYEAVVAYFGHACRGAGDFRGAVRCSPA